MSGRPLESEYDPFYAGYVALVPEQDILEALTAQADAVSAPVLALPEERERSRYAPEKWTVREVLGHIGDAERVFGYRAFCISRLDDTPLPGFDEKPYVAHSGFSEVPVAELVADFRRLRESHAAFLRRVERDRWEQKGIANGSPISLRAL
ncbi:MAG TPA: DinB family protein, partial [Candidatus Krumholzibacteria bacterium]